MHLTISNSTKMDGVVTFINNLRDIYAVELTNGVFSVFELVDEVEINRSDAIGGDLEVVGICVLENLTTGESFDANILSVDVDSQSAYNITFQK